MRRAQVRVVIGGLLIVAAALVPLWRLPESTDGGTHYEELIVTLGRAVVSADTTAPVPRFILDIPTSMRAGGSAVVRLALPLAWEDVDADVVQRATIQLQSAGFDIAPEAGTRGKLEADRLLWMWSIHPRGAGAHELLLRFDVFPEGTFRGDVDDVIVPTSSNEPWVIDALSNPQRIKLVVRSDSGLPQLGLTWLQIALALLGAFVAVSGLASRAGAGGVTAGTGQRRRTRKETDARR